MGILPFVAAAVPLETEVGTDARFEEVDRGFWRQLKIPRGAGAIEQSVAASAVLAPEDCLARPLAVADETGRRVGGIVGLSRCPGRTITVTLGDEQDRHGEDDGAPCAGRSISRPAHGRSAAKPR